MDCEREGRAIETGRFSPFLEDVVPVRGRRKLFDEFPWKADIACEFMKGAVGRRGGGERGLFVGTGARRPEM